MARRHSMLLTAIVLILSIQSAALAEEDMFTISGSLNFWNEEPGVAVNSKTGDILVVWGRMDLDNRANAKIYAVLCTHKGGGTFSVSAPKLLSGANDPCSQAYAAYDATSNTYLVTWRLRINVQGQISDDIQARVLKSSGNTSGGIITIIKTADSSEYRSPVAAVPQSTRKAVKGATYLFSWQSTPTTLEGFANKAGLWTMLLDKKGNPVAEKNHIMDLPTITNPFSVGESSPDQILPTDNVPFYLSMVYVRFSGTDRVQESYIVKLDDTGRYDGKVLLDSGQTPMNTSMAMVSKKKLLTTWYNFDEYRCRNQLLKSTLKKKKSSYMPLPQESANSRLVGLSDGGAFQMITTYPNFNTAHFDSKGRKLGDCKQRTVTGSFSGDFTAAEIPGTGKVLMIWRRAAGGNNTEIVGTVLDIN